MEWKDISQRVIYKQPDEVFDYVFDWAPKTNGRPGARSDWLDDGDSIASFTITAANGITASSGTAVDSNTGVKTRISGGSLGAEYPVDCEITTASGQVGKRRVMVRVRIK